ATCRMFAEAGARVYGFERDASRLAGIAVPGSTAVSGLAVDVGDESSVRDAVARVVSESGGVHVAVNCAGVLRAAKTVSKGTTVFPLEMWNEVIGINLTGTFNVTRFVALAMTRNPPDPSTGERGVIVNVASGDAWQGQIGQAAYSAGKGGVI